MHTNCKVKLYNERSLEQAKKQKRKAREANKNTEEDKDTKSDQSTASAGGHSIWSAHRLFNGAIYYKGLCIWFMKPEDKCHKNQSFSMLCLIGHV